MDDFLDELDYINQNLDTEYSWANQDFIKSITTQVESGKELSLRQKEAVHNIYTKGRV